ncbi:MAG: hypothetical protein SX243_18360 [Acidobacteriota bacterium]|nr:hypothetical protein [Acidobacteriota bacterium]
MSQGRTLQPTVILVLTVLLSLATAGWLFAQGPQRIARVFVTNLASPQPVQGEVEVQGTIRHARLVSLDEAVVSPAQRFETTQLTDAGVLKTDGYTHLVLSVQGQIKGRPARDGEIGAILIPEEEPILRAFVEEGQIQLPLEVAAGIAANQEAYFSASQADLPIAFPSYRLLLYNSTDKTASVNVFAYLTY